MDPTFDSHPDPVIMGGAYDEENDGENEEERQGEAESLLTQAFCTVPLSRACTWIFL